MVHVPSKIENEIKKESLTGKKRGRPVKKESNIEKYNKKQKIDEVVTGVKRKPTSDGNKKDKKSKNE